MIRSCIAALLLLVAAQAAAQSVRYEVSFPNAAHHEAEIVARFDDIPAGTLELRMSRTSPGRYALHEFAKNVYGVRVTDSQGRELVPTRPNPHQWDVAGHDGTVQIRYTLFGDRADGTYAGIDTRQAHLNMPAVFMWARGGEEWPIRISFRAPAESGWSIATQLVPVAGDAWTFTAPDLAYFLDSPTRLAQMSWREWPVTSNGSRHTIRLALSHEGTEAEVDEFAALARRVVDAQHAIFGELPEFDHGTYTFIAAYLPHVSGDGMEHRNSTILTSTTPLRAGMLGQLGTLSHEFFHAWNVERLRPRSLEPFDFEEANMSGELWFAEGFTSYYQNVAIRRAGIIDDAQYAAAISGMLNTVINARGRRFFSPVEMSMQAPFVDAAVSVDPVNRGNTFLSYYTWGAALGLGLDLALRVRFDRTLDDYMRALWQSFGRHEVPYTLVDLQAALAEVTGSEVFAEEFFAEFVYGAAVMDYEVLLERAGFRLRRANSNQAVLGALPMETRTDTLVVTGYALIDTPWYASGVSRGDRILSVAGVPVTSAGDITAIAARHSPGDVVSLSYVKRGVARTVPIRFAASEQLEVVTFEAAGLPVSDAVRAFRARWLGAGR
jgi:predicted metalloprotease with PDZ domain